MGFSKEPSFKAAAFDGVITDQSLALVAHKEGEWTPSGTGIIIAPRLLLTAKHVIEHFFRQHGDDNRIKFGDRSGSYELHAFQVQAGLVAALWHVTRLWFSTHTDLALLQLTPNSESAAAYQWRKAVVRLLPPAVGERIVGFGYAGGKVTQSTEVGRPSFLWEASPKTTVGEVTAIYPYKRDHGMLNFPCFQTNARFEGGMSGGPVFNDSGELCGLICAGLRDEHDGKCVSWVATLWPFLASDVSPDMPDGQPGPSRAILELVREGVIEARGLELLRIVDRAPGIYGIGLSDDPAALSLVKVSP
jgi:hypothetical protein